MLPDPSVIQTPPSTSPTPHEQEAALFAGRTRAGGPGLAAVWVGALVIGLFGGPRLGDHEVIVAQTARQMLADGDWVVPHYLDTAFLIKPPLPYWCTAIVSQFWPRDAATGLPVTAASARLTALLATLVTAWLVWRMGQGMFGDTAGRMAAIAYAASIGTMLFAINATTEALLTAFCTWSIAEYWWATRPDAGGSRRGHLVRFYLALALAMLAKGPMPLIVVVAPLAAWIALESPLRFLASCNPALSRAVVRTMPGTVVTRLRQLGLWWGLPLFVIFMAPWVLAVARREPFVLRLWNYEYLDRLRGDYPGVDREGFSYYLPILLGMVAPWTLSLPQALASPFRACHRRERVPLLFVWCWVVFGLLACSCLDFKKPYYIIPLLPGWALLLGPTLAHFFQRFPSPGPDVVRRLGYLFPGILMAGLLIGRGVLNSTAHRDAFSGLVRPMLVLVCAAVVGLFVAFMLFARCRRRQSFLVVAFTSIIVFIGSWLTVGPLVDNADRPIALVETLETSGVSNDDVVYWCDGRPDGRVTFYGNRSVRQIVDPYRAIVEGRDNGARTDIRMLAAGRICDFLQQGEDAYFVMERGDLKQLVSVFRPPYREAAVVRHHVGVDSNADWVVVTNAPRPGGTTINPQ